MHVIISMYRASGMIGSLPSFEGLFSMQPSDLPNENVHRPALLLETKSWTSGKGLPKVSSASSLDSLVLDDSVQFCVPTGPDLFTGEPSKSALASLENLKDVLLLPKLESGFSLGKAENEDDKLRPYPPHIRKAKIARYKLKLQHRRTRVPISRHFAGRSHVAKCKNRANGKFTKA